MDLKKISLVSGIFIMVIVVAAVFVYYPMQQDQFEPDPAPTIQLHGSYNEYIYIIGCEPESKFLSTVGNSYNCTIKSIFPQIPDEADRKEIRIKWMRYDGTSYSQNISPSPIEDTVGGLPPHFTIHSPPVKGRYSLNVSGGSPQFDVQFENVTNNFDIEHEDVKSFSDQQQRLQYLWVYDPVEEATIRYRSFVFPIQLLGIAILIISGLQLCLQVWDHLD